MVNKWIPLIWVCSTTLTGCSSTNITVRDTLCHTKNVLSTRMAGLLYVCYFSFILLGGWNGRVQCCSGFRAVRSSVQMKQPTKTVNVGCLATAFKECYLLSKRQPVISCLLEQKHKRREKNETKKHKRKKVITSSANSVNASITLTQWWRAMSSLLPPYDFQQNLQQAVFYKKCSQVELTSLTNSEK